MATQRIDGIISGLDTESIVNQLVELALQPVERIEALKAGAQAELAAWQALSTLLLSAKVQAYTLTRSSTFEAKEAASTNKEVLRVSASSQAAVGTYSVRVERLATTAQAMARGLAAETSTVGAGTLRIEVGGGDVLRDLPLTWLNGGEGVRRGSIRITDRSGASAVVDLSAAVTVQDVLDAINAADGIDVEADLVQDGIRLRYTGTSTSYPLSVQEVSGGHTAADLGILGTATGGTLYGTGINRVSASTSLDALNDFLGVSKGPRTTLSAYLEAGATSAELASVDGLAVGDVLKITDGENTEYVTLTGVDAATRTVTWDGGAEPLSHSYLTSNTTVTRMDFAVVDSTGTYYVDLYSARTVEDLMAAVAAASNESGTNANITLELAGDGTAFVLRHATGDASFAFLAVNGRSQAADLGFDASTTAEFGGTIIHGRRVIPTLGTTLTKFLNAGLDGTRGVASGSIEVTDRLGNSSTVNLAHRISTTLSSDVSGGASQIQVTSADGFDVGDKIRISDGASTEYRTVIGRLGNALWLDRALDSGYSASSTAVYVSHDTVEDVLNAINGASAEVTASVSDWGNAILIEDTSGGTGEMSIAESGSTTAADLGLLFSAPASSHLGGELAPQYISGRTRLSAIASPLTLTFGKVGITDRNGNYVEVNLGTYTSSATLQEVIDRMNAAAEAAGVQVTVSLNARGNALQVIDTSGGSGSLVVRDLAGGSVASFLGIAGTSAEGRIVGDPAVEVELTDSTTLADVRDAINASGGLVSATILNDGTASAPYRLVVTSALSGRRGRLVVYEDLSGSGLGLASTVAGTDASLSMANGAVSVQSSTNTVTTLLPGVTLELVSTSSTPVSVTVSRDTESIVSSVQAFVDALNNALEKMDEYGRYDAETGEAGILQGEGRLTVLRQSLVNSVIDAVSGLSSGLSHASQVGITLGMDGRFSLDRSLLEQRLRSDLEGVKELFGNLANVAVDAMGGTATAGNTAAGWSPSGAINGDTSSDNFGAGTNGWRSQNLSKANTWFRVDFTDGEGGERVAALERIVLHTIDSAAMPASSYGLRAYTLQYLNTLTGEWTTAATVTANTLGTLTHTFAEPIYTTAVRLIDMESNSLASYHSIVELEAFEGNGVARRLNRTLTWLTSTDGYLQNAIDSINERIEDYDEDIEHYQALADSRRERLLREFQALEEALARMQQMSEQLSAQLASLYS